MQERALEGSVAEGGEVEEVEEIKEMIDGGF